MVHKSQHHETVMTLAVNLTLTLWDECKGSVSNALEGMQLRTVQL